MNSRPRRRMDTDQRRRQLVAVALELFSEHPPEAVSLDDVAEAAGISRPLVYHYFAGKQSLYEATLRRAADDLTELLTASREVPPGEGLLAVAGRFLDFVEEHGTGRFTLLRGHPELIDEVREAAYGQLLGHLGVETPGPRLEVVLRSWISLAETTARWWPDGRHIPRAELELQLVHTFVALTSVGAAHDDGVAAVLRRILDEEPADGPFTEAATALAASW
ncbi:TetR/AcrR family transcriptional regulator [Streptomyces sp. I05A-00742]|uniref:TetR/AcrR family transcriptional regulator n=1 Tax=Streptomyces sp. I05A-00742 TaxID=2732853 RepID=UPI0014894E44|nr:TetR/AcrR family transcriptional regulator [Streptomyces sp. I05A-00742]